MRYLKFLRYTGYGNAPTGLVNKFFENVLMQKRTKKAMQIKETFLKLSIKYKIDN
jgi:hypothetical protein